MEKASCVEVYTVELQCAMWAVPEISDHTVSSPGQGRKDSLDGEGVIL